MFIDVNMYAQKSLLLISVRLFDREGERERETNRANNEDEEENDDDNSNDDDDKKKRTHQTVGRVFDGRCEFVFLQIYKY